MSNSNPAVKLFHHEVEFSVVDGTETPETLGDKLDIFFDAIYEEKETEALIASCQNNTQGFLVLSSVEEDPSASVELAKKHLALAGIETSSVVFCETFPEED